jgi:acetyltransferase-like isoleucine patch superfamily enzyme
VHPQALVETDRIGTNTRIWAFAHVQREVEIGTGCNVGDHCFIERGVRIGNDCVIKNGVSIWAGVTLEDRVFLGPNAVLTNDLRPRAKLFHADPVETLLREGASIGANATIVCGITVGRYAMVAAGAVVTKSVPDFALMVGQPARIRGYVCVCARSLPRSVAGDYTCECGRRFTLGDGGPREKP